MTTLQPGARIGVLGAGQLGRMLALAGARLGFDVLVYSPTPDEPAARVAAGATVAPYEDLDAVAAFAAGCDVVTYEFENVPVATARAAAAHAPLRPGVRALEVSQDRSVEKAFITSEGARTAAYVDVSTLEDLTAGLQRLAAPALLKTRRMGYDGKGQAWVRAPADAAPAFASVGGAPCILEARVPFVREVSQIAARSHAGEIAFYPLAENTHADGILRTSRAPANVSAETAHEARRLTRALLQSLDFVGVLAVEFFVEADGGLLINEIAPRVHNSGHWTDDACVCGQFEQHMRAVAGWPLGDPRAEFDVEMLNLIGPEGLAEGERLLADPACKVHLYGKRAARPGRKIGHVTRLLATTA